ncbi:MAG: hypothetical protein WBJ81_05515 [Rickettsiales bacterium]
MRGQAKNIKSITLTGKVYLLHCDEEEIAKALVGDVYLYLNDEEELYPIILNNYQSKGFKGYFKAKIFDGRSWCHLNNLDFFEDRLNQFAKTDICIYTYSLCQERLSEFAGVQVYRGYREHYTTQTYVANEYKGKRRIKIK